MRVTVLDWAFLLLSIACGIWGYYMRRFLKGFDTKEADERLRQKHQMYSQLDFDKKLLRSSLLMAVIFVLMVLSDFVGRPH